jgi:hypothetical protein
MGKMKDLSIDFKTKKQCESCCKFMKRNSRIRVTVENHSKKDEFINNYMFCSFGCVVKKTLRILSVCENDPIEITIMDIFPFTYLKTYTGEEFEKQFNK